MNLDYAKSRLEIKQLAARSFAGLGSVYGNIDLGGDIVKSGALTQSVQEHVSRGTMPVMGWQHDMSQVPGKWVEMKDTDEGLYLVGELAETSLGHDVATLLKMEAVNGLSIGYQPIDTERRSDGIRMINEAKLFEVSVVSVPMNQEARINLVKSVTQESVRALELGLRDAGVTRDRAKTVASSVFEVRDAIEDDEDAAAIKQLLDDMNAAVTHTHLRGLLK